MAQELRRTLIALCESLGASCGYPKNATDMASLPLPHLLVLFHFGSRSVCVPLLGRCPCATLSASADWALVSLKFIQHVHWTPVTHTYLPCLAS